jgi:hypothetical protein
MQTFLSFLQNPIDRVKGVTHTGHRDLLKDALDYRVHGKINAIFCRKRLRYRRIA